MNLHEYQGKQLLNKYGANIPEGIIVETAADAVVAAQKLQQSHGADCWVIKAQIHAGGRGKGGGVKVAKSLEEVKEIAGKMIGMTLVTHQTGAVGKLVNKVLVDHNAFYPGPSKIQEFYFSILLNRQTGRNIIMYSTEGGMDIEEVAAKTPHLIFKEEIDPSVGLQAFQTRKIAFNLGLSGKAFQEMVKFSEIVYNTYIGEDASMIEINPVLKTSDDKIIALDAKVIIDDNALYRHQETAQMRDLSEEDPTEVEATEHRLNFVKLDGNVGCMVNGAGLAMASMDIIKLSGGEPANFLDVGGGANAQTVEAGLKIILSDPNVKAILINIFGGIVRCDRVADGVVEAYKKIGEINIPIIVRLQGTNAEGGKKIIDESGLKVYSAITLKEAADLVQELVN